MKPVTVGQFLVPVASLTVLGGCFADTSCETTQEVVLSVVQLSDGTPVLQARVTIAQDDETSYEPGTDGEEIYLSRFEEHTGVTSTDGTASPMAVSSFIYARPCLEPSCRVHVREQAAVDRVTGEPFLIRVRNGGPSQIISMIMEPGTIASGEHYAITVLEIDDPVASDAAWSHCQGF
jgi:hypothetical protein